MASLTPRMAAIRSLYSQLDVDCADYNFEDAEETIQRVIKLEQLRREKQRRRMIRYRRKKRESAEDMTQECRRLDNELKTKVAAIGAVEEISEDSSLRPMELACRRLDSERAHLARENVELLDQLGLHRVFQGYTKRGHEEFLSQLSSIPQSDDITVIRKQREVGSYYTIQEASEASPWVALSHAQVDGWRVLFQRGEPSFYFHPFTPEEFDAAIQNYDAALAVNPPRSSSAGRLFCWSVHHAPLVRRAHDNAVIARARFTTRVRCSLEEVDALLTSSDINNWPLLTTPPNWTNAQRRLVSTEVLQQIDSDAYKYVMVCNLPGDIHTRFFQFTTRQATVDMAQKRSVRFVVVAGDSIANARSRAAEEDSSVRWVVEGGHSTKFTEVNKSVIEIEDDHWAVCLDELHARHLYVRWAQYVTTCYWSVRVIPPWLLKQN